MLFIPRRQAWFFIIMDPHAFDVNFKPTTPPIDQQAGIYDKLNAGYAGAIASQPGAPSLMAKYDSRFGIPDMQASIAAGNQQYDYLGNQISNMPKEIAQRSQDSILTQGQKDRQVQAESAPLLHEQGVLGTNLTRLGQNLGVAQTNSARMVSAEQVDQQKALEPWLKQYDTEAIMSAMRNTDWTFENQSELTRLITNAQNGITLSEGEKNRLNQLSIAEKGFENALKLKSMDTNVLSKGSTLVNSSGVKLGSNLGWS